MGSISKEIDSCSQMRGFQLCRRIFPKNHRQWWAITPTADRHVEFHKSGCCVCRTYCRSTAPNRQYCEENLDLIRVGLLMESATDQSTHTRFQVATCMRRMIPVGSSRIVGIAEVLLPAVDAMSSQFSGSKVSRYAQPALRGHRSPSHHAGRLQRFRQQRLSGTALRRYLSWLLPQPNLVDFSVRKIPGPPCASPETTTGQTAGYRSHREESRLRCWWYPTIMHWRGWPRRPAIRGAIFIIDTAGKDFTVSTSIFLMRPVQTAPSASCPAAFPVPFCLSYPRWTGCRSTTAFRAWRAVWTCRCPGRR